MPPLIEQYGMLFEWHDPKLDTVYLKRKITFDEVCSVFLDDYSFTMEDVGHYEEQRIITIGISNQNRLLTVIWVARDDVFRIITAFESSHTHKRKYHAR